MGNAWDGIHIGGGAGNVQIGGTAPGEGNVISANRFFGVYLFGSGTSNNVVQGNTIGFDATGFRGRRDMHKIPLLDKDTVRLRSEDLVADNAAR